MLKIHQSLFFNATIPKEIEALAQKYLSQPIWVKVGRVGSSTTNVNQTLEKVSEKEKLDRLFTLLVN